MELAKASTPVLAFIMGYDFSCASSYAASCDPLHGLLTTNGPLHPINATFQVMIPSSPDGRHSKWQSHASPALWSPLGKRIKLKNRAVRAFLQALSSIFPEGNFWRGPQAHPPLRLSEIHIRRIIPPDSAGNNSNDVLHAMTIGSFLQNLPNPQLNPAMPCNHPIRKLAAGCLSSQVQEYLTASTSTFVEAQ
jgi:hypothetical protein